MGELNLPADVRKALQEVQQAMQPFGIVLPGVLEASLERLFDLLWTRYGVSFPIKT